MESLVQLLEDSTGRVADFSVESTLLSLLMAFIVGQVIAWTYQWTHIGISYSRSFTQSLVLITMVVSMVMYVIGNSLITAFGLIGALAIIRFRNVLKDTRDTAFVFFALVLGMALGSQRYATAIVGTVVLMATTVYLHMTEFGTRSRYDGYLSCVFEASGVPSQTLRDVLRRFCRRVKQISVRRGTTDDSREHVYMVRLRDPGRDQELLTEMRTITGIEAVSLVLRDELAEV